MPYFFVCDNIFALQHPLKPYNRRRVLTHTNKIFNYRITRARINIECAFGLLQNKWAILQQDHAFNLHTFQNIIIALLCMHNMLITIDLEDNGNEDDIYEEMEEEECEVEVNVQSERQRDILAEYFVSEEGSVSWQDQYI